jgi:proteasome lid subunit RPN8/RPN11
MRNTIALSFRRKAERLAHFIKLDIIGFYHSHPDCAAEPSDYDTRHALPVYSYVIVSVRKGKVADCKSWELDPESCKQFQSEKLDLRKNRCANNFSEDESR